MQFSIQYLQKTVLRTDRLIALAFVILLAGCSPQTDSATEPGSSPAVETLAAPAPSPAPTPVKVNNPIEKEFIYNLWDELGEHPLDQSLKTCVDENAGDLGTRNCLQKSLSSWNEEVAKWSDAIRNQLLRGPAAEAFGESQASWEAYKEQEFKFIEMKYEGMSGTMYQKRMKMEKVILVRHRGLELYGYQQALNVER